MNLPRGLLRAGRAAVGEPLALVRPLVGSLSRLIAGNERIDFEGGTEGLTNTLRALPGVASVNPLPDGGSRVELEGDTSEQSVLKVLVDEGVTAISTSRPSLEEIYIRVIGDQAPRGAGRNGE